MGPTLVIEPDRALGDDAELMARGYSHHKEPAIGVLLQPAPAECLDPLLLGGRVG